MRSAQKLSCCLSLPVLREPPEYALNRCTHEVSKAEERVSEQFRHLRPIANVGAHPGIVGAEILGVRSKGPAEGGTTQQHGHCVRAVVAHQPGLHLTLIYLHSKHVPCQVCKQRADMQAADDMTDPQGVRGASSAAFSLETPVFTLRHSCCSRDTSTQEERMHHQHH